MDRRLDSMRVDLRLIAEVTAIRLWRLARRAKAHGCSEELVNAIRNEGWDLYTNYTTYPERLLQWDTEYKFKYAFR